MKLRLLKIGFGILFIGTLLVFLYRQGYLNFGGTAQAVGDLTIDWGVPTGDPIFVVTNMFPGDEEVRQVEITNNASMSRPIGIRGTKTNGAGELGDSLEIVISAHGTDLYGGNSSTGPKTLTQFFTDSISSDGIGLLTLASGETTTLTFKVTFVDSTTNDVQSSEVVFDITIGVSVQVPGECAEISFDGLPIFGTERGDSIRGTNGNDLIFALEGGDSVKGDNGHDCLVGGPGGDSLEGGNGQDVVVGGEDNDSLRGDNGQDLLLGEGGSDSLRGGHGNDVLVGGEGSDSLRGEQGSDDLDGGAGEDAADGGQGRDRCVAESRRNCEL